VFVIFGCGVVRGKITDGCVVGAIGQAEERVSALSGVSVGIASVWCWVDSSSRGRNCKGERLVDFLKCKVVILFVFIFCLGLIVNYR
jgi:hypothetical protein